MFDFKVAGAMAQDARAPDARTPDARASVVTKPITRRNATSHVADTFTRVKTASYRNQGWKRRVETPVVFGKANRTVRADKLTGGSQPVPSRQPRSVAEPVRSQPTRRQPALKSAIKPVTRPVTRPVGATVITAIIPVGNYCDCHTNIIKAARKSNVMALYDFLHTDINRNINFLAPYVGVRGSQQSRAKAVAIYNSALLSRHLYTRFLVNKSITTLIMEANAAKLHRQEFEWLLFQIICNHHHIKEPAGWSKLLEQLNDFTDSELKTSCYAVITCLVQTKQLPRGVEFSRTPVYIVVLYCLYYNNASQLLKLEAEQLLCDMAASHSVKDKQARHQAETQRSQVSRRQTLQWLAVDPANSRERHLLLKAAGAKRIGNLIKQIDVHKYSDVYNYLLCLHARFILGRNCSLNMFRSLTNSNWVMADM